MYISQITTVKGRYSAVKRNLKRWVDSGIDELVIVDYACPERTVERLLVDPETKRLATDPRVTLVVVPKSIVGEFFSLGRARNIGAVAAKHEIFFFLDADAWATARCVEDIREKMHSDTGVPPNILVTSHKVYAPMTEQSPLPATFAKDGQCVIRNHTFHANLHGYVEKHASWGGESYDIYQRAFNQNERFGLLEHQSIIVSDLDDHLRDQFSQKKIKNDLTSAFQTSIKRLASIRRVGWANPGITLGIPLAQCHGVLLWRGGRLRNWNPGEDDCR